ncbi:hypothetical protein [Fibrobacter sp.]|uniref:hypothetical protein n=1 Tax=Fibrobacter sp. TaxID=35828 RepID=UPI003866FCF7
MDTQWTTVIKPKASLLSVDFGELWQYCDFYRMFVERDIAKISTDGLPQPLFYLAGICFWSCFLKCLNLTYKTFVENAICSAKCISRAWWFLWPLQPAT